MPCQFSPVNARQLITLGFIRLLAASIQDTMTVKTMIFFYLMVFYVFNRLTLLTTDFVHLFLNKRPLQDSVIGGTTKYKSSIRKKEKEKKTKHHVTLERGTCVCACGVGLITEALTRVIIFRRGHVF